LRGDKDKFAQDVAARVGVARGDTLPVVRAGNRTFGQVEIRRCAYNTGNTEIVFCGFGFNL
jgi:hypothetical protein